MTAARLDTTTTYTALAACGEVAINGQAATDAAQIRSGPPRPRTDPAPLSPARAALAAHLSTLARLAAVADRAGQPVKHLNAQVAAAVAELGRAEANLAAIDAQHAARIAAEAREGARSGHAPPESSDAEVAVSRARRLCHSLRMALDEVGHDYACVAADLAAAKRCFDTLVLELFTEEHHQHLATWSKARDAFHREEATLLGLHDAIGERGRDLEAKTAGAGIPWLRRLESLRPPWDLETGLVERGPREVRAAAARWAEVLVKLKVDPDASF
jgi:hypothetical protein